MNKLIFMRGTFDAQFCAREFRGSSHRWTEQKNSKIIKIQKSQFLKQKNDIIYEMLKIIKLHFDQISQQETR